MKTQLIIFCFSFLLLPIAQSTTNLTISNTNETRQLELPAARIVGGRNAAEGQFPHQVSLRIGDEHYCGGSIISANYVVTAAHCVTNRNGRIAPASMLSIRAGSTQINTGGQVVGISRVIVHPRYVNSNNDIALLRLNRELTFSDLIKAIPLANAEPPAGASIIISGWGSLSENGPSPTRLQFNTLRRISRAQCLRQIGSVPPTILCLAHTAGNGACYGDSGGPAVYNGRLVGVSNYIIMQCGLNYPDGYANVHLLRNWLRQNSDVK